MPAITVPTAPPLARWDRVELAHAGTWDVEVGGQQTFTREDFAAAVAAIDCPAVGRPVLKLGHLDDRGDGLIRPGVENRDGEPALGWVSNMNLANDGNSLTADLVGMPGWLGQIAASAYPSRSIEGCRNFVCQLSHQHPFVVSAVALLGLTPPGVGTVGSLQDHVKAMYGVAAASNPGSTGEPFAVTFPAVVEETPVPKRPELVAAAVTVEKLRSAFHEQSPWEYWITEIRLDPLELIVSSDNNNETFRVPVTIGADGDSFTFGAPVKVEVTYVDKGAPEAVAAAAATPKPLAVRFVSRAESRPGAKPAAAIGAGSTTTTSTFYNGGLVVPGTVTVTNTTNHAEPVAAAAPNVPPATDPPVDPAHPTPPPEPGEANPTTPGASPDPAEPDTETEPEGGDAMSLSEFRSRLGLDDTADEAAVLAALDALKTKAETPPPPPAVAEPAPELVAAAAAKQSEQFAAAIGQIETLSTELAAVKAEKAAERKAAFFAAAVQQGKIAPADRASWEKRYDRDAELVGEILGAIKPGTAVPIAAAGYVGDPEPGANDDDLWNMFPPDMRADADANNTAKVG